MVEPSSRYRGINLLLDPPLVIVILDNVIENTRQRCCHSLEAGSEIGERHIGHILFFELGLCLVKCCEIAKDVRILVDFLFPFRPSFLDLCTRFLFRQLVELSQLISYRPRHIERTSTHDYGTKASVSVKATYAQDA